MLPAFLTTVLFSISAVCAQRTTTAIGGVAANFWRILIATAVLGIWAHTAGQGLQGKALPWFLVSGLIGFGIGDLSLYQALPRIGSRLSTLIVHCVASPVAALTEWYWLETKMSGTEIIAAAVVLAGVAFAIAPGRHLQISRRTFWIGILAASVAALAQAFGAVLTRVAFEAGAKANESIDGMTAAYQRILAGLALALLFFLFFRSRRSAIKPASLEQSGMKSRRLWPWVLVNAIAGPAIGVACYQSALKDLGTGIVMPIVALTPLVIIPFSRYVEGERPRKRSLLGGAIAVAGVFILAGGIDLLRMDAR